jgi:hypothetical protein
MFLVRSNIPRVQNWTAAPDLISFPSGLVIDGRRDAVSGSGKPRLILEGKENCDPGDVVRLSEASPRVCDHRNFKLRAVTLARLITPDAAFGTR